MPLRTRNLHTDDRVGFRYSRFLSVVTAINSHGLHRPSSPSAGTPTASVMPTEHMRQARPPDVNNHAQRGAASFLLARTAAAVIPY